MIARALSKFSSEKDERRQEADDVAVDAALDHQQSVLSVVDHALRAMESAGVLVLRSVTSSIACMANTRLSEMCAG